MVMETNKIYLGDCYQLIKDIPDKSVDLVYIDIPYLIDHGGGGNSKLAKRIEKEYHELNGTLKINEYKKQAEILYQKMQNSKDKNEYEKWHSQRASILNKINLNVAGIVDGIDYSILDELVRVMKYIYIYGVAKNKFLT